MDNPVAEIPDVINLCAGADSADNQVTVFHRVFTRDASFLHPLCYVPLRPDPLKRVIGIFLLYRAVIPHAKFDIQAVSFDERSEMLFVHLLWSPWIRLVSLVTLGWRPAVPMHIIFHLRKMKDKWCIDAQGGCYPADG
jgi:hypothetical protein